MILNVQGCMCETAGYREISLEAHHGNPASSGRCDSPIAHALYTFLRAFTTDSKHTTYIVIRQPPISTTTKVFSIS